MSNSDRVGYSFKAPTDPGWAPDVVRFEGPGINDVVRMPPNSGEYNYPAHQVSVMLSRAYAAGRESLRLELKRLLNIQSK